MQKFSYKLLEDGTYCVMGYQGDESAVVLPESIGESGRITVLYDKLFEGHSEITSIHIPDTVTDIGEFAFAECENLRHLRLPAQLTNLWGQTFARCGIEEITLPEKVKRIPPFAFKDCKRLKKVVCGPVLKKIDPWAFAGCTQLTELITDPSAEVSPEAFDSREMKAWQRK